MQFCTIQQSDEPKWSKQLKIIYFCQGSISVIQSSSYRDEFLRNI